MAILTEAMKAMLSKQLPILATVTKDGLPDIGPKRSLRAYNDTALIYNENTGGQTLTNIQNGSKVAIAIIDREALDGYRFIGSAKVYAEGTAEYQNCLDFAANNNMKAPKVAVVITLEEIYTLKSGPTAGTKL